MAQRVQIPYPLQINWKVKQCHGGATALEKQVAGQAARGSVPLLSANNREVPEWSIGHDWKSCVRENVPRVQIPFSLQNIPEGV